MHDFSSKYEKKTKGTGQYYLDFNETMRQNGILYGNIEFLNNCDET